MDPDFRKSLEGESEKLYSDTLSNLPPAPLPSYTRPTRSAKKSKKWLWFIPVLVILAGAGGWAYLNHKTKTVKPNASPTKAAVTQKPVVKTPSLPAIPTSSHSTASFGMSFNYPTTWTVVDSGTAGVTATSPVMNLTAANGQSVQGQIVFNVDKQGALPPSFTSSSVAVLGSQLVNYSKPSSGQAADTYLSFVQYPSTVTRGGLDGLYVTGNYGYQKDQTIPASNVASVSPLIYFNFYSCATSVCPPETRQPLTIASASWRVSSFSQPILTVLQSISF